MILIRCYCGYSHGIRECILCSDKSRKANCHKEIRPSHRVKEEINKQVNRKGVEFQISPIILLPLEKRKAVKQLVLPFKKLPTGLMNS